MKFNLSSTKTALFIIGYNCLIVPFIALLLVFVWRVSIGSIYGYAKYDPSTPVIIWLLAATVIEIILVANLAKAANIKGMLIGLGVSLLLSPAVLFVIWFSIILGNR